MYGKGCPHSRAERIWFNIFKGQHRISPGIISEIEHVAGEVANSVNSEDAISEIVSQICGLNEFSHETISNVFSEILNHENFPLEKSKSMMRYQDKRAGKSKVDRPVHWGPFLSTVMTDLFFIVALYINQKISMKIALF